MEQQLDYYAQLDAILLSEINVQEISHIVCDTERGRLELKLPEEGTGKDYRFHLAGNPIPEEQNRRLIEKGVAIEILQNCYPGKRSL